MQTGTHSKHGNLQQARLPTQPLFCAVVVPDRPFTDTLTKAVSPPRNVRGAVRCPPAGWQRHNRTPRAPSAPRPQTGPTLTASVRGGAPRQPGPCRRRCRASCGEKRTRLTDHCQPPGSARSATPAQPRYSPRAPTASPRSAARARPCAAAAHIPPGHGRARARGGSGKRRRRRASPGGGSARRASRGRLRVGGRNRRVPGGAWRRVRAGSSRWGSPGRRHEGRRRRWVPHGAAGGSSAAAGPGTEQRAPGGVGGEGGGPRQPRAEPALSLARRQRGPGGNLLFSRISLPSFVLPASDRGVAVSCA